MVKAMIFAAGLGSRLRPLTNNTPKALVKLGGKTLLEITIEKLIKASVKEIVINIHHFHLLMRQAIEKLDYPGIKFHISDESIELLGTGGGLLKAAGLLDGEHPFFVHNVDVISDIDLKHIYKYHLDSKAFATLASSDRPTTRYFLWQNNLLCGWKNTLTGQQIHCYPTCTHTIAKAFSGIHVINPEIFGLIEEKGNFSINNVYLRLAKTHPIRSYMHNPTHWVDIGTLENYKIAQKLFLNHPDKFL